MNKFKALVIVSVMALGMMISAPKANALPIPAAGPGVGCGYLTFYMVGGMVPVIAWVSTPCPTNC